MDSFFQKFPPTASEGTAIEMMHERMKKAKQKQKEKNLDFVHELQILMQMVETFLAEKLNNTPGSSD